MHIIALFNEIEVKLYDFLKIFFLEKPRLIKLRKFNKTAEFQEKQITWFNSSMLEYLPRVKNDRFSYFILMKFILFALLKK